MRLLHSVAAFLLIIMAACSGDYRPRASGPLGQAVVIMDSTEFQSETANAIREVYSQGIFTLPGYEPLMDLRFRDFKNNEELELLRKNKNIIVAAPLSDTSNTANFIRALLSEEVEQDVMAGNSFAFPLENQWYKDQWTIILTAPNDSVLAEKIMNAKRSLTEGMLDVELQRWTQDIYDSGEQLAVEDSLWKDYGWKLRVQHDWRINIDTSYTENSRQNHFLTMRRDLPENQRWFWAWWINDVPADLQLSPQWINTKRDSLMRKWIEGTREGSYITTDYEHHAVDTDSLIIDGHNAYETLGVWTMVNDAMAGPFASMTIYDEENERLFMLEFAQFAPKYDKRRFVRQFRAMLRTFESDSSWTSTANQPAQ